MRILYYRRPTIGFFIIAAGMTILTATFGNVSNRSADMQRKARTSRTGAPISARRRKRETLRTGRRNSRIRGNVSTRNVDLEEMARTSRTGWSFPKEGANVSKIPPPRETSKSWCKVDPGHPFNANVSRGSALRREARMARDIR